MSVLRVLVPLVLFSACAGAQSAPVPSQPGPQAQGFQLTPITPQIGLAGRSLPATPQAELSGKNLAAIALAQTTLSKLILQVQSAPENKVCYAIRSYDFARDGADSDATRLTGSSTCRLSSKNKLKSAVRVVR